MTPSRTDQISLQAILLSLRGDTVRQRFAALHEGREEVTLAEDSVVQALVRQIDGASKGTVEGFLDLLIDEIEPGVSFHLTDILMAVVFALHESGTDWGADIVHFFAHADAASISRTTRLSRRLLKNGKSA